MTTKKDAQTKETIHVRRITVKRLLSGALPEFSASGTQVGRIWGVATSYRVKVGQDGKEYIVFGGRFRGASDAGLNNGGSYEAPQAILGSDMESEIVSSIDAHGSATIAYTIIGYPSEESRVGYRYAWIPASDSADKIDDATLDAAASLFE